MAGLFYAVVTRVRTTMRCVFADRRCKKESMRLATTILLLAIAATLGGCSKCGFFWDDWRQPGTCRSDAPKSQ